MMRRISETGSSTTTDGAKRRCAVARHELWWTLFWVTTLSGSTACFPSFDCSDRIISSVSSPDAYYAAELFERDCGATTGFNRQVAIRDGDDEFDGDRGVVFVIEGRPSISLRWESERELSIVYEREPDTEVFRSEPDWQDVRVEYRHLPRNR